MAVYFHLTTSIILVFIVVFLPVVQPGAHEHRLLNDLLSNFPYRELVRPAINESEAVTVAMGMAINQIDIDLENRICTTHAWQTLTWTDATFSWEPSEYGGISSIRLPPSKIWIPDVVLYNRASGMFDSTYHTNVIVYSSGYCYWVQPGIFKTSTNVTKSRLDDNQNISLKFGSWTYNGRLINLTKLHEDADLSMFKPNREWRVKGVDLVRNVVYYPCCEEPYIDIELQIQLRRKSLYRS